MTAQYQVLEFVENDMVAIAFALTDNTTGTAVVVNITGYTLTLQVAKPDGSVFEKAGVITDAPNGAATFTMATSDLNFTGTQDAHLKITDASGNTWRARGFGLRIFPMLK